MSNYKALSFTERTLNKKYKQKCNCTNPDVYEVTQSDVLDEKTQRLVRRSELRKCSDDTLSHLKVSDFALENLLSVGATLNPCQLSHDLNTNMNIAETALNNINNINE